MKCLECGNKTRFYELFSGAHIIEFDEAGNLMFSDSGEEVFEDWECMECNSKNVEE